jgi:hypothetical protein
MMKVFLHLMVGAGLGAVVGGVNECIGGSCPLLCLWWKGALFGAVAGLAIYVAGRSGPDKSKGNPLTPPRAIDAPEGAINNRPGQATTESANR